MNRLREFYHSKFNTANLPPWAGLLLLLITCFFSFGTLLGRLGFFQDDWHHVYYAFSEGSGGLMRFLFTDSRPLSFLVYIPFFKLLGFSPSHWHWSLMALRFLTVLVFWFSVQMVWPKLSGMATWLALFFAIYPSFPLQSLSVAYTLHWFLYLAYMISVLLMLHAANKPKSYLFFTGLAVLLQIFHLLMIEYYAGLDIFRLVLLWFLFRDLPTAERFKKVIKQWLPYLGVLVLYAAYRLSYSTLYGYDRFASNLIVDIIHSPLTGILAFLQTILQDTMYVVISPWYAALDPGLIDFSRVSTFTILASIAGFAVLSYLVVSRIENTSPGSGDRTAKEVIFSGFLAVFLGLLPSWLGGLYIFTKNPMWSGRLALPAMLGAGMILTGLAYLLIEKSTYRHLFLSIMLGIAVGFQVQTARDFQASWDKQLQFFWQLYWRAPGLAPNTLVVSDAEILPYMGYYPTAFALNVLYDQAPVQDFSTQTNPRYWFNAGSEHIDFNALNSNQPTEFSKYSSTFFATNKEIVSISFEPQQQQCLWVLRPTYSEIRFLSTEAYRWMDMSNLDRIQAQANSSPPTVIFGDEPNHTWCYYYEKADLASQKNEWQTITRLWKEAKQQDFRPRNSVELIPFIEAFARTGEWQTARELTNNANVYLPRAQSLLCTQWRKIEKSTQPGKERDMIIKQIKDKLGCQE